MMSSMVCRTILGVLGGRRTGETEGAGTDHGAGHGGAKKVGKTHGSFPTWAAPRFCAEAAAFPDPPHRALCRARIRIAAILPLRACRSAR
jgi:hypothetical protein